MSKEAYFIRKLQSCSKSQRHKWRHRLRKLRIRNFWNFRHTPDMGEISGFGGSYEAACQDMLAAGCRWLNANTNAHLVGHTYRNVFGLFTADNEDARTLDSVVSSVHPDCTGAMHHAVMSRLFYIAKHGWRHYCKECRKRKQKR
jgi:hypothetical protein